MAETRGQTTGYEIMTIKAYKHGYTGSLAPFGGEPKFSSQSTFSVGIFQWLPKKTGVGLKKSAVKYRVRGYVSNADAVYTRAKEICSRMDNETWVYNKKSEMVK